MINTICYVKESVPFSEPDRAGVYTERGPCQTLERLAESVGRKAGDGRYTAFCRSDDGLTYFGSFSVAGGRLMCPVGGGPRTLPADMH